MCACTVSYTRNRWQGVSASPKRVAGLCTSPFMNKVIIYYYFEASVRLKQLIRLLQSPLVQFGSSVSIRIERVPSQSNPSDILS